MEYIMGKPCLDFEKTLYFVVLVVVSYRECLTLVDKRLC